MNKYILLLLAFAFAMQSFTGPKKELKTRVEALLELSVSLTDNSKEEIERIKLFLEPSEDRNMTAIALYQTWHRELKTFGKQEKKIQKVTFLNRSTMAFVDVAIERKVPQKDAKKEGTVTKEYFTMKATWKLVDGKWMQRTKVYAK
ncbi:MAG: hypothetical protein ACI9XO_003019 [Paraglaciecola sp.]|jgi:hypothetical protein